MKKFISLLMSAAILVSATITASASHMSAEQQGYGSEMSGYVSVTTANFKDTANHWAKDYINRAYDKNWIEGYPDKTFRPNNPIKRGEAIIVFSRFLGIQPAEPETNYFSYSDISENGWMVKFMESSKKLLPQYLNGPKTPALEAQPITREDVVYALIIALKYDNKVSTADESILNMFSDKNSISAKLRPYIAVAVSNGIVSGYDDGTFGGTDPLTRAEFATLLAKASTVGFGSGLGIDSIQDLDAPTPTPEPVPEPVPVPDPTPIPDPVPVPVPEQNATLTGLVINESGVGVSGAKVTLSTGATTNTDANGQYTFEVSATNVTITAEMSGYVTAQTTKTIIPNIVNYVENLRLVTEAVDGTISGKVYDAVIQGGIVSDVEISFRAGGNVKTGTVVAEAVSDADGNYSVTLPTGTYTAEAKKDGYSTAYETVVSRVTDAQQDITLAPYMEGTAFVLTWGETPWDLDSHLTGPKSSSSSRFHVFYADRYAYDGGDECANLDRDDIDSYGPETVTLVNQIDGIYRYTVHDYSNRSSESSNAMSLSGAKVVVYVDGELKNVFNVPVNQGGTIWTVFELNGNTITPINTMNYQSNPSLVDATSIGANNDVDLITVTATEK